MNLSEGIWSKNFVDEFCSRLNQRLPGIPATTFSTPAISFPKSWQLRQGQEFLHSETIGGQSQGLLLDKNDSIFKSKFETYLSPGISIFDQNGTEPGSLRAPESAGGWLRSLDRQA